MYKKAAPSSGCIEKINKSNVELSYKWLLILKKTFHFEAELLKIFATNFM